MNKKLDEVIDKNKIKTDKKSEKKNSKNNSIINNKGILEVEIVRAYNLSVMDSGLKSDSSDPYIELIIIGASKYKTKVIENSLDPIWNEIFNIPIDLNIFGDKKPSNMICCV